MQELVSYPAHARLLSRKGPVNFLGIFPRRVRTNEIVRSVIVMWHLPYNSKIFVISTKAFERC